MIYFVTAREIGRVKIGFSDEPRGRFVKMRTDSPVPLALERICEGTVDDERALHATFADYRVHGEWFALAPDIEDHMDSLPLPSERVRVRTLTAAIAETARISASYASMIANGHRKPPRSLAIRILRETGWRHSVLEGLTDEQINVLEQVEPWERRPQGAAA